MILDESFHELHQAASLPLGQRATFGSKAVGACKEALETRLCLERGGAAVFFIDENPCLEWV